MANDVATSPGKRGLDDRQKRLVDGILNGLSDHDAGAGAGYTNSAGIAAATRSLPVQTALMQARMAKLSGSMAQAALKAINELIIGDKTPAATRFAVSKWVLEQAGHTGLADDGKDVPLHEMTAAQLAAFMAKAQAVIDEGGEAPIIALMPDNGALSDL